MKSYPIEATFPGLLDHPIYQYVTYQYVTYQYVTYQYVTAYSVCDLWGYLKSVVYQDRPQDIDTLEANIRRAINNVPEDMLRRSMHDVHRRGADGLRMNGGHLSDVIFTP